jgi:hypothetical protein
MHCRRLDVRVRVSSSSRVSTKAWCIPEPYVATRFRHETRGAVLECTYSHLGPKSGAASNQNDGAITPLAHVREDRIRDIHGSDEICFQVFHKTF